MVHQSQFIEQFGTSDSNYNGYSVVPFSEMCYDDTKSATKIPADDYKKSGTYAIFDQSTQNHIAGYYDAEQGVNIDYPAILFGDHSRVFKYIQQPFFIGADGVKIIRLKTKEDPEFVFYELLYSHIPNTGYNRHFKWVKELSLRIVEPQEQQRFLRLAHQADKSKFGGCKSQFIEMFGGSFSSNATAPLSEMVQEDRPITYGVIKPGDFVEEGVVLVRVKDIVDGKILLADLRRITNSVAQNYLRSTLSPGDILLSIRGTVGRTAIVPEELDGANITQDTARISLKEEYNNHFIRCVLDSPVIQDWIQLHVKGLAVKGINLEDVRRIPIPSVEDELQEEYTTLYHQADKSKYLN